MVEPPEEADRQPGGSPRTARDLLRRLGTRGDPQPGRRFHHHFGELAFAVGIKPLLKTETIAQGRRQLSRSRRRAHQREGLEAHPQCAGLPPLPEDHVQDPVLEGRVERLLAGILQAVDLVDVDEPEPGKTAEEGDELMGISDVHPQHLHQPRAVLTGKEPGGRRLADAGLTAEEHVAQGFVALLRGAGGEEQVLDDAALPDEVPEAHRADSHRDARGWKRRGYSGGCQELRQIAPIGTENTVPPCTSSSAP